jgi:hypothetical protein
MTTLKAGSFALGVALAATGAWAQGFASRDPVILAPGIQLSTTVAGTVELSPDQKLARAYALCDGGWAGRPEDLECKAIVTAWIKRKSDGADRAFIEEVARDLK